MIAVLWIVSALVGCIGCSGDCIVRGLVVKLEMRYESATRVLAVRRRSRVGKAVEGPCDPCPLPIDVVESATELELKELLPRTPHSPPSPFRHHPHSHSRTSKLTVASSHVSAMRPCPPSPPF